MSFVLDSKRTLPLRMIAELDVAAASGIVLCAGALWVVADDELTLARYDLRGARTGQIQLLPGTLPDAARERKAAKPDFEALLQLPDASLMALGSGSTPARRRAAWVQISTGQSRVIDLTPLYVRLERELPQLNIEGAALLGESLFLASRGNGTRCENALVRLDWPTCAAAITAESLMPAEAVREIVPVSLGQLGGQQLALTDLTSVADILLFTAAAEASPNTYDDGSCAGSAVGLLDADGRVHDCIAVAQIVKLEGVCAQMQGDTFELLLVADPDDRAARAPLMAASYRPGISGEPTA